ncbi:UPF0262 family protein [Mesorhizobium sp. M0968]
MSLRGPFSRNEHIERERALAVAALIRSKVFIPVGHARGPYRLHLALDGDGLLFQIATEKHVNAITHRMSVIPMRRFLKHYIHTCQNYYDAMSRAPLASLTTIDAGRCALHDEGAEFLKTRIADKLVVDSDTARQLFVLVYVLLMRIQPLRDRHQSEKRRWRGRTPLSKCKQHDLYPFKEQLWMPWP